MITWTRTITQITLHHAGDSPVFGNSCTTVTLDDESGGWFLRIEQESDQHMGSIRVELDELRELLKIAEQLMAQETPADAT